MAKPPRDVTPGELAILEKLWEHQAASIPDLSKWLYGSNSPADLATVQKLISRLEAKGLVTRDRSRLPHMFFPAIDRDDLITQRLKATAEELSDGNLSSLITHLVKSIKLTSKQRQKLRDMLSDFEK